VPELVKPVDVIRLHLVPGDDQDVIRQFPLGKVFEYGEGVRSHLRQEGLGRAVEELHGRDVRLEIAVVHQLLNSLGVRHECGGLVLVPQAVGVSDGSYSAGLGSSG
jgi:hypothetical protein